MIATHCIVSLVIALPSTSLIPQYSTPHRRCQQLSQPSTSRSLNSSSIIAQYPLTGSWGASSPVGIRAYLARPRRLAVLVCPFLLEREFLESQDKETNA